MAAGKKSTSGGKAKSSEGGIGSRVEGHRTVCFKLDTGAEVPCPKKKKGATA